ncbi:MAG: alpha/beta hydrolase [Lutimonas sp.]
MKWIFSWLCLFVIQTSFSQTDPDIFDKFTPKFYTINGYKINVEVLGDGPPIVFLAGGPGNSHDYMQGSFGQYYKTNKVIFIDMLGRGKSDDAKDANEYSIANDTHMIEEVRKLLKLDKIALVGHSYGTVPAQDYAVTYPGNVDKLVLINGFHSGEMWQANCDSYNHYAKTHFPEYWYKIDSLRNLGYVSSDPIFSELYGSLPTKYVYYHDTKIKGNQPKEKYRNWNNDVYYGIVGRDADFFVGGDMIDWDVRRKLKSLNFPVLICAGRYDGVSTPEYAVQYKKYMPKARFVMFEESGHNPYLEEPDQFYTEFEKFFEINQ